MLSKLRIDPFILALLATVALAYFFPAWGSPDSPLPLDGMASVGIALIFFLYGLKLSPEKMRSGLGNWKLHLLVQLSTFVLFPLIVIPFEAFASTPEEHQLWLAFLFLAALPSTVAFSVMMTTMAKGNVPAAIFNASLSGLIGIVITPLWVGLYLKQAEGDYDLSSIYVKLLSEILVPVFVGMLLQKYLGPAVQRHKRKLANFDRAVILLIIYKSFARSFEEQVFSTVAVKQLLGIGLGAVLLFFIVFGLTAYLASYLGFSRADRTAAQYCGSTKSLVHGTVFAKILFPAGFPLGIIFLPLMLFHAFQILTVSIIAARLGKKLPEEPMSS